MMLLLARVVCDRMKKPPLRRADRAPGRRSAGGGVAWRLHPTGHFISSIVKSSIPRGQSHFEPVLSVRDLMSRALQNVGNFFPEFLPGLALALRQLRDGR